ncbi:uncharacterized protein LOC114324577 [Diabrotica virgifera virgifera]|uniref:Uncharacterized protein LOC114324577 n=1 Tax=Diabrotica virgifera virgifera TaxID=50390 RepID=A0A6P7F2X4_DIAVI|nr:uncharacterized protein LOC114324577 [Diabrotica virgifera virgifera]
MRCANLVLAVALLTCSFAEEHENTSDRSDYKRSLTKDCENTYSATCLKLDIVSWVDKLNENENFSVFPGVSIVRENASARANTADIVADLARDFPNDPDARLDAFLVKKVQGFFTSHSVKLNLFDAESAESARKGGGGGGGGGGKKGGGGLGLIFAAAAMMKSTLLALALGALAALAGKALMTGLISLLLSAIIGLKSLSGGGGKTTYEVVSKPVYTHSSSHSTGHEDYHHGHSGYGRSFDMPLPLGLQPEYKPA